MKQFFDEKIAEIAAKSAVARPPAIEKVNLKKKSNQIQYEKVAETLTHVNAGLELIKANNKEDAIRSLKEAVKCLEKRKKMIRLADKSELGWATVLEYESDSLASNSDDERKMRRAEVRAEQKRKRKFSEREEHSKKFRRASPRRDATGASSSQRFFRGRRQPGPEDRCYGCGKTGHWRSYCPHYNPNPSSFKAKADEEQPKHEPKQ